MYLHRAKRIVFLYLFFPLFAGFSQETDRGTEYYIQLAERYLSSDGEIMTVPVETGRALAISNDNSFFVSTSDDDYMIRIFDMENGSLLKTLSGHNGSIYSVAINRDDTIIVSCGKDNSVKIWTIESGECIAVLRDHKEGTLAAELSDDGKFLVSGGKRGDINIYETSQFTLLRSFKIHERDVSSIKISGDNKYVVSCHIQYFDEDTTKVWDFLTGEIMYTCKGHGWDKSFVNIGFDGKSVISAGNDNKIIVSDILTGDILDEIRVTGSREVNIYSFSQDGRYCASKTKNTMIDLYDLNTREKIHSFPGHDMSIKTMAISNDNSFIVSAAENIKIWPIDKFRSACDAYRQAGYSDSEAYTVIGDYLLPTNRELAASYYKKAGNYSGLRNIAQSALIEDDYRSSREYFLKAGLTEKELSGIIAVYLFKKGRYSEAIGYYQTAEDNSGIASCYSRLANYYLSDDEIRTLSGHESSILSLAISADDTVLVSGSADSNVKIWDLQEKKCIQTYSWPFTESIRSVQISSEGTCVTASQDDRSSSILILDRANSDMFQPFVKHRSGPGYNLATLTALSEDDAYLVSACGNTMKLWDFESGTLLKSFTDHEKTITSLALGSNNRIIVTGGQDGLLRIWDLESGECTKVLKGHTAAVNSVTISQDEKFVISGAVKWDMSIKIWDVSSGECIRTLKGHQDSINSVAISPGNKYITSGSADKTVRVWDFYTGDLVKKISENAQGVNCVLFDKYGNTVIAGSSDNTIKILTIDKFKTAYDFFLLAGVPSEEAGEIIGDRALQEGSHAIAADYYLLSNSSMGLNKIAEIYLKSEKIMEAAGIFELTGDRDGLLNIAEYYEKRENLDEAVRYYAMAGRGETVETIADNFMHEKDYLKALDVYTAISDPEGMMNCLEKILDLPLVPGFWSGNGVSFFVSKSGTEIVNMVISPYPEPRPTDIRTWATIPLTQKSTISSFTYEDSAFGLRINGQFLGNDFVSGSFTITGSGFIFGDWFAKPTEFYGTDVIRSSIRIGKHAEWLFSGNFDDTSGNNRDGNNQGCTFVEDRFGISEAALAFDGKGSCIAIPDVNLDGDFSICAWVYLTGKIDNKDALMGKKGSDLNFWNGRLRLYHKQDFIEARTASIPEQWEFWVITRDSGTLNLFRNGKKENSTGKWDGVFQPEFIGSGNGGFLEGRMDDITIYDRALHAFEIASLYSYGE